jgi:hypothetical protein
MNHAETAVYGEIDIKVALVLAEVGSPDRAVVAVKRGGYRTPVDQVAGVPDEESGGVIEAGVGHVKVVSHANGAGVRMIPSENRVAIKSSRLSYRQSVAG